MQTSRFFLARQILLSAFVALIFGTIVTSTGPALAKNDSSDALTDNPVTDTSGAPTNLNANTPPTLAPQMALGDTGTSADPLSSFGPSSGTLVGNRALELRDEVLRLRSSVNLNSNQFAVLRSSGAAGAVQYHSTVAAITARLQNGTTRGNPILMRQWDEANGSLDEVTVSLGRLNSLLTAVNSDSSVAAYLLQSVQAAFELSGAVDEDHDQLKLLRDDLSRQVVQLDYLRTQTTNDIQRQTNYLTTERTNLQSLAFAISRGEMNGTTIMPNPILVSTTGGANFVTPNCQGGVEDSSPQVCPAPTSPVMPGVVSSAAPMSPRDYITETSEPPLAAPNPVITDAPNTMGRLLVLIRYNQPVVEYQQQLSHAVGTAIEHRPNADFSVVAVSPTEGNPADLATAQETAKRNAEDVKRSLVQLGLSPSHITVANTQMQSASVPEVHVYVR